LSKIPQKDGKLDSHYYAKNPHNHLEIYFGGLTNRFFTYTGDVISDKPVADCTEAALWFLDTHMQKARFKKEKKSCGYDPIAAARKAKNGGRFIALYDNGDISGYSSPSEADLALCNTLAFFTGGNEAEIDKLFRQSKLYREKWEREDYREATIQKAVSGCNGRFHIAARPMPTYIFYDPKTESVYVSRPLLAKFIWENLRYLFVRDSARGGVLRYVYEDGGVYALYSDDMLRGVIKGYITSFDETILRMGDVGEVFQQLVTDLVFIDSTALNADEGMINFHNGILQLDTMQLIPHSSDYLSTVQIPCEWKGKAQPTPVFDRFMQDLTCNQKDIEKLLLQFMGVCLSNVKGWRLKKALFLVGKGDIGKSQLKSLTERLLGKGNYVGIDLKELEARFGTGNIYMKRLAGSADMSFASIDEVKVFKKTTGGDSLFAEFKGQNGFEFVYDGLLWFCMNRLPKFGGDNGQWVYNRIMVVECNNVTPPQKQDKQLLDKLYAEREGIVYKAWCADNNQGYAKTAKEFRMEIAEHLKTAVTDMTTRRAQGMVYKDYTLTNDAKGQYARAYGYDGAEFLSAAGG
jgi:P4 family phage/plasmid primase-like protien